MEIRHKGNDENALEVLLSDANKTGEGVDTFRGSTTERILKAAADVGEVLTFKGADLNLLEELARKLGREVPEVLPFTFSTNNFYGGIPWPEQSENKLEQGFLGAIDGVMYAGYGEFLIVGEPEILAFECEFSLPLALPIDDEMSLTAEEYMGSFGVIVSDGAVGHLLEINYRKENDQCGVLFCRQELGNAHEFIKNADVTQSGELIVGCYLVGSEFWVVLDGQSYLVGDFGLDISRGFKIEIITQGSGNGIDYSDVLGSADVVSGVRLKINSSSFKANFPVGARDIFGNLIGGAA